MDVSDSESDEPPPKSQTKGNSDFNYSVFHLERELSRTDKEQISFSSSSKLRLNCFYFAGNPIKNFNLIRDSTINIQGDVWI